MLRAGTTDLGVPFLLRGRLVRITVPARTPRGRRIVVRCGRLTSAELLPGGIGFRRSTVARATRVFQGRRRMTLRLNRDVAATAEWCEYATRPSGRYGAVRLKPRIAVPPAPLKPGPGVREGVAAGGRARFLIDGSRLTLRTARVLPGDIVLFLACYFGDEKRGFRTIGARTVAIGHKRRAVTVDLGRDVEPVATSCLAEDSTGGGGDLFTTRFAPRPT